MNRNSLYPVKFNPIYQYRIWGGRRLAELLSKPLPPEDLIGEAWILSDRKDHPSHVLDGFLKDRTICYLMENFQTELMGKAAGKFSKFPLLLKFLDAQTVLSVQVHPSDDQKEFLPPGENGKTEAWIIMEANEKSKIYAGLKEGTTKESLASAIQQKNVSEYLPHFQPKVGDAVYIPSGTVHTMDSVVVFEVQENSDVTYRLYDWDRIDEKTGKPRELQVDKAIECINFSQGIVEPVVPEAQIIQGINHEKLFDNEHFILWRISSHSPFTVGEDDLPRILVCAEGYGTVKFGSSRYSLNQGEVMLIPAISGIGTFEPHVVSTIFEIALPWKRS